MNTLPMFPARGAPSWLRLHALEAWYEFLRVLRTPAFALPTLCFPVVFYLVFAVLVPGDWGSVHKASYLLATYGAFGVMGPALFGFGVGLALERKQGLLELRRVSPMPASAYFLAKIAMSLAFALAVVGLLAAAGTGLGGVSLPAVAWLKLLAVLLLGTLPFCAIGLFIGTLAKGEAAVAIVNLVYLPLSLLGGLWLPLKVFPAAMQSLAVLLPSWHLGQMALGAVGQAEGVRFGLHAAALGVATVIFLVPAALRLQRE
ncbi:ABC transporter permease [Arenimonas sp.]|uniref:ABC transporter permease n=1 Tax=Arenimonas sp. TaxID=1872635 RepID=UPI0035B3672A